MPFHAQVFPWNSDADHTLPAKKSQARLGQPVIRRGRLEYRRIEQGAQGSFFAFSFHQ